MPGKRRRTPSPVETQELKKRVTRSSTKSNTAAVQGATVASLKAQKKAPKDKRKTSTQNPSSTPENVNPKPSVADIASASPNITTFTITDSDGNKPIQCQKYFPGDNSENALSDLIFTHGAGGSVSTPAIANFCTGYANILPVLAFQGSMNLTARVKSFHACISAGTASTNILLGGRSMGARAAVMAGTEVVAGGKEVNIRLILVSYPLKGPKEIRDQILLGLPKSAKVLFVVGDRDAMCPLDLLEETRTRMIAASQLIVVRGADHGMHTKPASRESDIGEKTGQLAAEWVIGKMGMREMYVGGIGDALE